jgi:hypothetical protein
MRAALGLRVGPRPWARTQLRSGRIDRRQLGRAPVTDRLFRQTLDRPTRGLSLCLLLDESGSMAEGDPPRYQVARQVAVLAVEALRGVTSVQLEVYSHTSSWADCLIRHLFGSGQADAAGLGTYWPREMSYDHRAVEVVAERFRQAARFDRRILIVLSDGAPHGVGYGGEAAVRATREAVAAVRAAGTRVLAVAIRDYRCEDIYGEGQVLKFSDLARLVGDMRALLTRLLRDGG